jgi:hypothetical protein
MAAFVTVDQYATATQQTITPDSALEDAIEFALDAACDEIRNRTCQTLDAVEGDVITLDGTDRQALLLPELPVTAVNSVTIDKDLTTELDVTDYVLGFGGILRRRKGWPWGYGNITVDYDHGYETIPADLVNVAIQAARSGITIAPGGLTSETIGGYSYTRDATVATITTYQSVLDPYRVPRIPVP